MQSSHSEKLSYDEEADLPLYNGSASDDASLPLYTSPQDATKPALPDKSEPAAAVRDFLTKLLVATRELSTSEARNVASSWTVGTGDDLATYPAQMYRELFGSEHGWMVYKEVKLLTYENEHPERHNRMAACMGLAVTLPVLITAIVIITIQIRSSYPSPIWTAIAIMVGVADLVPTICCFACAVASKTSVSDLVAKELKDSFFKKSKESSS